MGKQQTFTFNLPSPQYRRFLDFIAKEEGTTPGKSLCKFLHWHTWSLIDKKASEMTHKELAMEFANEFDIDTVSWILGSCTDHWQRLSRTVGPEKAKAYMDKFLPLWSQHTHEIDKEAGLDYFDIARREELSETE